MKRWLLIVVAVIFAYTLLSGCAPSDAQIALALAKTQTAAPVLATSTPLLPTNTPIPTPTIAVTPTLTANQLAAWDTFESIINNLIAAVDGVRLVYWVRMDGNVIDISLQTKWQAADGQSKVHFDIIRQLSGFCTNSYEQQVLAYTGVLDPSLRITTKSVDELYEFQSLTTFQQCVDVGTNNLNFKDWQTAANVKQTK